MEFLKLVKVIDENQLVIFTTKDIADILGVQSHTIQNYLETLANNELIVRLEKGKFCRTFLKDQCVIGSNLVQGGVISYASALEYHGLSKFIGQQVFIASKRQKINKSILGFQYRFIKIRPHKYFGFQEKDRTGSRFLVSDREKTLLDCFDLPRYTKSFSELVSILKSKAFDPEKMFHYGLKINNISVLKRIAYLSEKFALNDYVDFREKVCREMNDRYTLLDPTGEQAGSFHAKWRIRDNLIQ